jgi:DNA-binding response OmpR family regulator
MKLLVIEDEPTIAAALTKGLQQERYTVDCVMDGSTGCELALAGEHDLVIADVMLPGKDGVEICQVLRQAGIQTPVLLLTARDQIEDRVKGLDAGADDYLTKPFHFDELLARVRALTRRKNTVSQERWQYKNIILNPQTQQVTQAGIFVPLTQREFALLEYFLRHPGEIVTKDQLVTRVWQSQSAITQNTVEAYIGYIRKKLAPPSETAPTLETVFGRGYRLI